MTPFTWIALGLLVGAIAKFIMPGKDPGGLLVTVAIGIVGALLGGAIGTRVGWGSVTGFDLRSLLVAISGAILLLVMARLVRRS
jgi:uncharacterized membrane protein YeaQ/YmgE (transglycosylase-associated protein family)